METPAPNHIIEFDKIPVPFFVPFIPLSYINKTSYFRFQLCASGPEPFPKSSMASRAPLI